MSLAEVIARHAGDLMARPGVFGVGEGREHGSPCLVVFAATTATQPPLPDAIEGYPVIVKLTGPLRAQRGG